MPAPHPLLPPNQQCQSTEGTVVYSYLVIGSSFVVTAVDLVQCYVPARAVPKNPGSLL